MCIIFASSDGYSRPTLEELELAEQYNPDGIGLAYFKGRGTTEFKSTDVKAAYVHKRMLVDEFPLLIHFRKASVGPVCNDLCHPFKLFNGGQLMHNGHIPERTWQALLMTTDMRKLPKGPWSDSRAIAYVVNYFKNLNILEMFAETSRFATLDRKNGITYYGTWEVLRPGLMVSSKLEDKVLV